MALRRYLLNGGFLMVDDFWGDYEWDNFYQQIKRVFPDREPEELPHRPRDLPVRLPAEGEAAGPEHPHLAAWAGRDLGGATAPDSETVHYKGIFDDKGRMMVDHLPQHRPGRRLGARGRETPTTSTSSPRRSPTRWGSTS